MKLYLKHLRTVLFRPNQDGACPMLTGVKKGYSVLGVMEKVKRHQGSGNRAPTEPLGFCCWAEEWGRRCLSRGRGATNMGPGQEQAWWHHFKDQEGTPIFSWSYNLKTTFIAFSLTHAQINFDLASEGLILSLKLSTSISVFSWSRHSV